MTTRIGHVMILASAGSGKTYALTNRFVKLLALGAAPERIVALTFTRKAAGEFFDEILKKLAGAAADATAAAKLARELELPAGFGAADFLRLLRAVVDAMPRLRLGTLDGFFARIAQAFPLELGLAGEFEILQEHAAQRERAQALGRLFARAGALADAQREFMEAFKRATFGVEEKRMRAQLDAFLDAHHEVFLSAGEEAAWGQARRIWPDGSRWLDATADGAGAARRLRAWVESAGLPDKQRGRWLDFLEAWSAWAPGVPLERPLTYVLEKALDAWDDLGRGAAVLEFDRKRQELSADAGAALADLARHVVAGEIARKLEITRGIFAVLSAYEKVYHDAVRRAGKLTFADVQRLLEPAAGGPRLGAAGEIEANRLLIDYRLDGEIDHWLLDEFQDTSFGQWSVLQSLIDEVVQDPAGGRSFFYVGDVKQSIFAWREGDPRLFREIFDRYNAHGPGTIVADHLVQSWRSGPPVIAAVNRVFGDTAALTELFPCRATEDWNREWRAHVSARPALGGHVALLHAADEAERFATALALLQEIEPLERGLSCALLVQSNRTAAALADYLRREGGLPAVAESDLHVCTDNPLGAALLALAQVAAHPGDTLAWEHVTMTPLGAALAAAGLGTPEAASRRLLADLHADGFERTLSEWARAVRPALAEDDKFTPERIRQFAAAARIFDATGSRDVAEFVAFMAEHKVRDAESAGVLRVMTIHKSKGLGFDLVLLPDIEGQKLDSRRDGLAVERAPDRSVRWVLDLPSTLFASRDETLAAHVRAAEADACYEALSLLYVAMTRAKQAMYVITKPPGKSTSRNYAKLLAATLGEDPIDVAVGGRTFAGAYAEGDPAWYLRSPKRDPALSPESAGPTITLVGARRAPRLAARRPSEGKGGGLAAAALFAGGEAATEFGRAVHAALATVAWSGEEPAGAGPAADEARAVVRAPALASVWARPAGAAEVWRERAFEIVLDDVWITGVFDRVIVTRDAAGRATGATVFDFKTDAVAADEAELAAAVTRHAEQVNLYRRVAARLTGLTPAAVAAGLVFTRIRRLATVPWPA